MVMVVDAEPERLEPLRALLLDRGYEVETAPNGAEALGRALARPPDLLITDLLPPALRGFELLRRWKADPSLRAVPVLVLTSACRDPEAEALILRLGADAVVRRPAEPGTVLEAAHGLLQRSRPDAAPAPGGPPTLAGDDLALLVARRWAAAETAREELERARAEREARLRAIIDAEPECVKLLARDGSLLEMNPAGLRMIEAASFDEVRHRNLYPLVAEPYRAAFRSLTERAFAGESGTLEFEIVGLKGGRRWLETRVVPLRDAAGRIDAALGITRDITDRKGAEVALRESEARYRTLFESAADPVLVVDSDGRLTDANSAACRAFGYERSELIGRPAADLVVPEEVPRIAPEMARLRAGEVVRSEWRCRPGTGRCSSGKDTPPSCLTAGPSGSSGT